MDGAAVLGRSDELLGAYGWCRSRQITPGALSSAEQQWRLARAWYSDRMSPDWRRRTPAEAEALFARLGLSGEFWRLVGDRAEAGDAERVE